MTYNPLTTLYNIGLIWLIFSKNFIGICEDVSKSIVLPNKKRFGIGLATV